MKRFISGIIFIIILSFTGCTSYNEEINSSDEIVYDYEEIQKEIIRFHVIANSDDENDQNLKLKVRDEIIKFLQPKLAKAQSIDESRDILKENDSKVKEIATKVIEKNGYNYSVKTELSRENFPEKMYGNIVLPQGEYEAYRILIGESVGQNWWCVMFPPLCFVDVTKGEVAYKETEVKMNEVLNEKRNEEYNLKFKFVEVLKEVF